MKFWLTRDEPAKSLRKVGFPEDVGDFTAERREDANGPKTWPLTSLTSRLHVEDARTLANHPVTLAFSYIISQNCCCHSKTITTRLFIFSLKGVIFLQPDPLQNMIQCCTLTKPFFGVFFTPSAIHVEKCTERSFNSWATKKIRNSIVLLKQSLIFYYSLRGFYSIRQTLNHNKTLLFTRQSSFWMVVEYGEKKFVKKFSSGISCLLAEMYLLIWATPLTFWSPLSRHKRTQKRGEFHIPKNPRHYVNKPLRGTFTSTLLVEAIHIARN